MEKRDMYIMHIVASFQKVKIIKCMTICVAIVYPKTF